MSTIFPKPLPLYTNQFHQQPLHKLFFCTMSGTLTHYKCFNYLNINLFMDVNVASQRGTITGYIAQFQWNNTVATSPFNVIPFRVFTETLRKYPILQFLDRSCLSDYELPSPSGNGTTKLPAGTGVFVSVLGIYHDLKYFPQPEMFDPDRFTEENKRSRPKYTYIPFGEGPRMCIGNITLSILNNEIVDFKDMTVKFTKLCCVKPCSSVGTK